MRRLVLIGGALVLVAACGKGVPTIGQRYTLHVLPLGVGDSTHRVAVLDTYTGIVCFVAPPGPGDDLATCAQPHEGTIILRPMRVVIDTLTTGRRSRTGRWLRSGGLFDDLPSKQETDHMQSAGGGTQPRDSDPFADLIPKQRTEKSAHPHRQ